MGNNGLIDPKICFSHWARHAASADQSNTLLQLPLPAKFSITLATVYIPRSNRIL